MGDIGFTSRLDWEHALPFTLGTLLERIAVNYAAVVFAPHTHCTIASASVAGHEPIFSARFSSLFCSEEQAFANSDF